LAPKKYWRRKNIGGDRNYWRRQNSSGEKFSSRQKSGVNQNLTSTKILRQPNLAPTKSCVNKNLASTKCWRRRRRIHLLFGSAESTAADFSQTSMKISFVSQMVLIPLRAVAKCGVASGRPAFIGGLSPALYRLVVPARHAKNVTNFRAHKILASS
jgi:hypothetical protein